MRLSKFVIWLDEKLDDLITAMIENVWCQHDWEFKRRVREQNIRGFYDHDSNVYRCRLCEKFKTEELPTI